MNQVTFDSKFQQKGTANLPEFTSTKVLQMPLIMGDLDSIPDFLSHWTGAIKQLFAISHIKSGVGYITIDEKDIPVGQTHRRAGLHVDGVSNGRTGCSFGGGTTFATPGDGMLVASSVAGCRAWNQTFKGWPGNDGECDHLLDQCDLGTTLEPNTAYWMAGMCVHESVPVQESTRRQFVRLSMPNDNPWFEGFTLNPNGVEHAGKMMPRRTKYMDA